MAKFTYETNFNLTNPVNDLDAAFEYLSEDDMTEYLVNDIKYDSDKGKCDIDPNAIEHIEWILRDEQSGKIVLDTTVELSDAQLEYVSNWVSGQNSDGLGEGFEQQEFAEVSDEDDEGYIEVYDMASFDWQTNDYPFKLVRKSGTNESIVNEAVMDKCCETCTFYVYDSSTGQGVCNYPRSIDRWIRQKEEDVWTTDYDYCSEYVPVPDIDDYEYMKKLQGESKSLIAQVLEADSTLCVRAILEKHLMEDETADVNIDQYKPTSAIIKKIMDYRAKGSMVNVKAIKDPKKLLTYYYTAKLIGWTNGWESLAYEIRDFVTGSGWSKFSSDVRDTINAIDKQVNADPQYADSRSEDDIELEVPDSKGLFTFDQRTRSGKPSCWLPKSMLKYFIDNDIPVHFGKRTSGGMWDRNGRQWSEVEHLTIFPDSDDAFKYDIVVHTDEGGGPSKYTGDGTQERTSAKNVIQDIDRIVKRRKEHGDN